MPIDLTGKSFNIAQSLIDRGQPLNLDFSVSNNGDEYAAPFSFDIVISRDGEISSDDFRLGTYEIKTGLEAGADSEIKTYRYFTPDEDDSFWKAGNETYTVGIRLDPHNQFFETDKDNNSNQGAGVDYDQIQVLDFGIADLQGSFIDVANQQITPGQKVDLSFTIANDSPQRANPFSIDVYLSPGIGTGVKGAVKLGTYDIRESIGGNGEISKSYRYPTPDFGDPVWKKGDGKYYIAFDIDSKDEVEETREGNNSRLGEGLDYTSFNVTGLDSAADLVVKNFKVPENAKAGESVTVEYEIVNEGEKSADFFAAGFYLFGEDYLANHDSLSVEDVPEVFFLQGDDDSSLISLEPESSTGIMTTEIILPKTWSGYSGEGNYYLGLEADPFDDVVESNDANNSLQGEGIDYQQVTIEAPKDDTVDLVGTKFEIVQDQIVPGQEFDLGFTVANEGLAEVDAFSFDLYLSQDSNITTEDFYLGKYEVPDGLAGRSDTGLKSIRYTAPELADDFWGENDGTYYAGMIIDPANDVVESNEENNSNVGNNLDYSSTNVTGLEEIADLRIRKFDVTEESITTGDSFEVSYRVVNNGTESAEFFDVGFFIFNEDYLMNHDTLAVEDSPQVYFLPGNDSESLISLDAGTKTNIVKTELIMPEDWPGFATGSGEYYIGAAADVYGDIAELDETNNSLVGLGIDYEKVMINVPAMDV
ncbi:hypothetical protein I4641_10400 [Waterburya agarophytonicola K14]|uniref:CARDB domain-containing protein n=1 Tax=Waterburya agarophytonicola KI4 TaxID=2874699 RepID=A0A964FFX2_9CYAN|nr:CARDB domain-containing protein [Waterburya agarophytonicola]MCC0177386.1 hypothetical protein [Waterburya agarophytonicola KI4]